MAPIRSKLMELSYSDPKFQIRLTGYADTVIIDSGAQQTISAIRFGGYPEVVRALSDAIYGGASVELKQGDTTLYLDCRPKGYRRLLSHDGIYAVATLMANDDSQTEENTTDDSDEDAPENPRKCYIFCPPGDRASLFAEVDRKTAAPLIPEFQDYVLDSLISRGDLRQMKVLSFTERMEAWSLTLLPEDRNVTDILEQGLKDGRITIPGAVPDAADGFAEVNSVTSYLNTFGVTVADRIRSQFVPKFDPASEPLSEEILEVNDYIHERAGYSLYDAQLAVAEAVKRQLCQHKMALIVAECGSGKTKLSAAAAGALNALKRLGTRKSFNLVMCPSHVTGKWVREIAETLPDTYGMVVKSITWIGSSTCTSAGIKTYMPFSVKNVPEMGICAILPCYGAAESAALSARTVWNSLRWRPAATAQDTWYPQISFSSRRSIWQTTYALIAAHRFGLRSTTGVKCRG